jgi:hypothetical protein
MTNEAEIARIANAILEESKTDIVGLWAILWEVRAAFPNITSAEARTVSLSVLAHVLSMGVEVGNFVAGGDFQLWDLDQASALRRIEELWSDPERELNLDDNVWLSGPGLGYRTIVSPSRAPS